jgi:hypothetical protein
MATSWSWYWKKAVLKPDLIFAFFALSAEVGIKILKTLKLNRGLQIVAMLE